MSKNANIIINVDDDKAIGSVNKLAQSFSKVEKSIDKANEASQELGDQAKELAKAYFGLEAVKAVGALADAALTAAAANENLTGKTKETAEAYVKLKQNVADVTEGMVLAAANIAGSMVSIMGINDLLEDTAAAWREIAGLQQRSTEDMLNANAYNLQLATISDLVKEYKVSASEFEKYKTSNKEFANVAKKSMEEYKREIDSANNSLDKYGQKLSEAKVNALLLGETTTTAIRTGEWDKQTKAAEEAARKQQDAVRRRQYQQKKEEAERKRQFEEDQKKSLDRRKMFLDEVASMEKARRTDLENLKIIEYTKLKEVTKNLDDGIITFEEAAQAQKLIEEEYSKDKTEIFKKAEEKKQQYVSDSYKYLAQESKYLVDLKSKEAADIAAINYRIENDSTYDSVPFLYEKAEIQKKYNDQRLADSKSLQESLLVNEYDRLEASKSDINAYYDSLIPLYKNDADMRVAISKAREAEIQKVEEQTFELRKTQLNEAADGFTSLFSVMAKYDKKYAVAFKALAISQAIANTAVGITKAFAQGGPMGFITGAGIAAAGAAQVATIKEQKFATGGIVDGTSYTGDKIPVSVNSGEMILTRAQQGELFNKLNGGGSTTQPLTIQLNVGSGADSVNLRKILSENSSEFAAQVAKVLRNNKFNTTQAAI